MRPDTAYTHNRRSKMRKLLAIDDQSILSQLILPAHAPTTTETMYMGISLHHSVIRSLSITRTVRKSCLAKQLIYCRWFFPISMKFLSSRVITTVVFITEPTSASPPGHLGHTGFHPGRYPRKYTRRLHFR